LNHSLDTVVKTEIFEAFISMLRPVMLENIPTLPPSSCYLLIVRDDLPILFTTVKPLQLKQYTIKPVNLSRYPFIFVVLFVLFYVVSAISMHFFITKK
jgi:hypothetical protein